MFADDDEDAESAAEELAVYRERYDLWAEEYSRLVESNQDPDRRYELREDLRSLYWQLDPDDRERADNKWPLV